MEKTGNCSGAAVFLLPLEGNGLVDNGVLALSLLPHPHPNPPLEGEGIAAEAIWVRPLLFGQPV